jgi:hypothetical protein
MLVCLQSLSYYISTNVRILAHLILGLKKTYPAIPLTAFLRSEDIDQYLTNTVGVNKIVHGTFDEAEKISSLARDHDIVINVGSSMDPTLSKAIVSGQKQRLPGLKTTLIHVSGAGNFTDTTSRTGSTNVKAKVWNVSCGFIC